MKKLLIIGWVWPEPNSSAAGSRMVQLIEFFQLQNYAITFASSAQKTEHMVDLTALKVKCIDIKLNCASFDDFINELEPDIVLFDRFMIEEQFGWRVSEHCPQALKILDTEDLFCLRHARHQAFKQHREMTDADLLNSDLAKREIAAIFRVDVSLMISHVEIELLQRLFNIDASLLHYCPFMYTQQQLQQRNPDYEHRAGFISIGNFRHPPNWDAVLWLKQTIWPLIRKQLPKAQLFIYGAYPPPKATDLQDEKSGFLVKGWVDDASLAMQSARICLAPLRFGAGIKGKLSEAMICGTPSVTTAIGAESMQTDNDWGGFVTDNAQAFADAAVVLYQQQHAWQKSSDLGVNNAQLMFSLETHFLALANKLSKLQHSLVVHRQQNFIGSMLNHHHHKSTQYMSQWIEAKNKGSNRAN
ncbi:MAG: glycosyltransferase family 4 protein [Colwellia sp.]